jgi:hypothetical protein
MLIPSPFGIHFDVAKGTQRGYFFAVVYELNTIYGSSFCKEYASSHISTEVYFRDY